MLKTFLDKHKGRIAFVLGAGPSLHKINTEILKSHVVITINSSINKTPFAQYFFSCDPGVTLRTYWLTLKDLKCMLILCCKHGGGMGCYEERTGMKIFEGIDEKRWFYFDRRSGWKIEKSDELIMGISSIHCAVHFAHILGCSPIVLLGCDCKSEGKKHHFYDFPGETNVSLIKPEYKSFTTDPYEINSSENILGAIVRGWKNLRKTSPEINIINSSGGVLNMFPRMSLEEVIKRYKK